MSKVSQEAEQIYAAITEVWKTPRPKPAAEQLLAAAKLLARRERPQSKLKFARRNSLTLRRTSGNRIVRYKIAGPDHTVIVNVDHDWETFVHQFSHTLFRRLRPRLRPHSAEHARLELRLVRALLASGLMEAPPPPPVAKPAAKPKPPKPDPTEVEAARLAQRRVDWNRRLRRAQTALKTLDKLEKNLQRRIARRASTPTLASEA